MKYSIFTALNKIAQIRNIDVNSISSIEFEDGSGHKFVYRVGTNIKRFINLSKF